MQSNNIANTTASRDQAIAAIATQEVGNAPASVVCQHPLSFGGHGVHPYDRDWHDGYWGLPEAIAWIATRDLGIVAGVLARLRDKSLPYELQAKRVLALLDAHPHFEPDDLYGIKADETLRNALYAEDIVARGDREDDPRASEFAIPSHFWRSGEFRFSERGSWWAPNPQLRLEWGALRFARGDFMKEFQPFRFEPKAPSSKGDWIDVVEALTWETYGHAMTIEEFRAEIAAGKGLSIEHHRICLDMQWRSWRHRFDPVRSPLKGQLVIGEQAGSEQTLDGPSLIAKADLEWIVDENGLPVELCVRSAPIPRTDDCPPEFTEARALRFLREKLGAGPDPGDGQRFAVPTGKRATPNLVGARRWLELIFETHEPGWKDRDELMVIVMQKFSLLASHYRALRSELTKQPRFKDWGHQGRRKKW